MKVMAWFYLSCKRQIKHPFFVVLLVLVPVALFGFSRLEQQDSGKIRIAVYSGDQELVPEIMGRLAAQDGMFEFYVSGSEQALKEDVAARKAECGYLFTENFKLKLDERRFKRSIEVYTAPSTIMGDLAGEVVFAAVIDAYSKVILEQFLESNRIFTVESRGLMGDEAGQKDARAKLQEELLEIYRQQLADRTFSFRYETLQAVPLGQSVARITFPVKGMLGIYLMVAGMFSAVALIKDERSGLFVALPYGWKLPCKMAVLAAPVFLAGLSAGVTLWVTGNAGTPWKEGASLLVYLLLVTVVSYAEKVILKDPLLLCGLIPIFILSSLVVCPIFVDLGQWLPGVAWLRYLMLPYYYL